MKAKNVIEINGRLYDASSGEPLPQSAQKSAHSAKQPASKITHQPKATYKKATRRQSVDGVRRVPVNTSKSSKPAPAIKPVAKSVKVQSPAAKKPSTAKARSGAPHARTQPKRSTTLHRRAVSTPVIKTHAHDSRVDEQPAEVAQIIPKADQQRVKRAEHANRSPIISRFGQSRQAQKVAPKSTGKAKAASHAAPLTQHLKQTHATPQKHPGAAKHVIKQAVASTGTASTHKAHKSSYRRGHGTRFMKYGTTALVVLLLSGYVAYLNIPGISLKIAANRAGFAATMPRTPAGYSLNGPIAYSPGQVTVNFKANTDDRRFSVKQQQTTWDSVALLENYVTKQSPSYSTYQDRGLTIYLFDGSNAAWVNGGKLYTIEGKGSQLDTAQLLEVAASM